MGKKTNYKRLWRREKEANLKLHASVVRLKQVNEAQIDVLERVRDGGLVPDDIFVGEKEQDAGKK